MCFPFRVGSLDDMRRVGLYINDLNLFDCSRDIVLNGWQYASQLEFSLEQVCIQITTRSKQQH